MNLDWSPKLNTKIIILVTLLVVLILLVVGFVAINQIYRNEIEHIEQYTLDLAASIATRPGISRNIGMDEGREFIQSQVEDIRKESKANFIVVMDMEGIRYSHPIEARIGDPFVGGDERRVLAEGERYVSSAEGTLGQSRRAFVPIYREENGEEKQVGAVSVGRLETQTQEEIFESLLSLGAILFLGLVIGTSGAIYLGNNIKASLFGLEPDEIAKKLEERNAILNTLNDGIVAVDKDRTITSCNRAARDILALDNIEDGIRLDRVFDTDVGLSAALEEGNTNFNRERIINNTRLLVSTIPIRIEEEIIGAVACFSKKSKEKKLARKLAGTKKFIEALRSQNHEFNNKLHTIHGLIQLEEYEKVQEFITSASSTCSKITRFLLHNVREDEIAGLLLRKHSKAQELNIIFDINKNSSLSESLNTELKNSLLTIIGNLIENAFDSILKDEGQKGKIYLEIFDQQDEIKLRVKDNGVGISRENQDLIFFRGFSSKEDGEGIGLKLVKENVEIHSGSIEVSSIPEEGAEFIVKLPKK
ncbi:ATP-binding protein [Halarsenatibacter silvermanii]|uniref:histidine kinase n=1 Tax=Halarsenatibacter silvermanii TaxID=321763 RepID=A0A1G9MBX2_9FIRM|nr:sensor histidine kinase [Halarsenatibacter silvermanii]SDL71709.1 two-component system, CitB family, sensor histidine kinase DctS [Halarsenatibacter silvermanii]